MVSDSDSDVRMKTTLFSIVRHPSLRDRVRLNVMASACWSHLSFFLPLTRLDRLHSLLLRCSP